MRSLLALLAALSTTPAFAVAPTGFTEVSWYGSTLVPATGMGFAPDGSMRLFVTNKNGPVVVVDLSAGSPPLDGQGGIVTTQFSDDDVITSSECGVIGLAFDPNYVVNRYVYIFATVSSSEQQIIRYTDVGGVGTNRTVVIEDLPTRGANHDGGGIGFGPDGKLYWSIGDLGNGTGVDADLASLASKFGRAELDGRPVNDNPFNDGVGPNSEYTWARGFRNPFTLTFEPATGALWSNTVGTSYEQVFIVGRGDHAGYNDYENNQPANGYITPVVKYRTNGSDNRSVTNVARAGGIVTITTTSTHRFRVGERITLSGLTNTSFNGASYVRSLVSDTTFTMLQAGPDVPATAMTGSATTDELGGSITGGVFVDTTLFPVDYRGNFIFGDYNSGRLVRVQLDDQHRPRQVDSWTTGIGSSVDLTFGPDGALYSTGVTTGTLRRFQPSNVSPGLVVTGLNPWVVEGGRATFSVRLATAVTSPTDVTVTWSGGDADLSVGGGASLSFDPTNWMRPQTVTLAAADDPDALRDEATFTVASAGLTSEVVTARSIDNNGPRLVLSSSQAEVAEGGQATFLVSLSQNPGTSVTVTSTKTSGSPDITLVSGQSLQFTTGTWSTPQPVTLAAASDPDYVADQASITVSLPGYDARVVLAQTEDDEPEPPTITSTPPETARVGNLYSYQVVATGDPLPSITLAGEPGGMAIDQGLITWTPSVVGAVSFDVVADNGVDPDAVQTVTLDVLADAPPVAVLTRPTEGEVVTGAIAELYGDCLDDVGCVRGEFYVDGVLGYTDMAADNHYHFGGEHNAWNTDLLASGPHTVSLRVVDSTGQEDEVEVGICVRSCDVPGEDVADDGAELVEVIEPGPEPEPETSPEPEPEPDPETTNPEPEPEPEPETTNPETAVETSPEPQPEPVVEASEDLGSDTGAESIVTGGRDDGCGAGAPPIALALVALVFLGPRRGLRGS